MQILVVAATDGEIGPLLAQLGDATPRGPRLAGYRHGSRGIDVLTTGVGMVATAAWCSRALMAASYDLAFNFGVCGAFDPALAAGTVVHVTADRMAELGAEDGSAFLTIQDLALVGDNEFPFQAGQLVNAAPPASAALRRLPAVSGITVNTVHGDDRSIARTIERFGPEVESMEGAAFMYACLVHGVPFAQVRAVSNVVERRNRGAWNMPAAIRALNGAALEVLNDV